MKKLLLLLLINMYGFSIQGQWRSLHPKVPLHQTLLKAIIPGNSTQWYAAGNSLGVSTDQGNHWQLAAANKLPVNVSPETRYYDLVSPSENTSYFLHQNSIYKTTDRGEHWENVLQVQQNNPRYQASAYFTALHFINNEVGYAVGEFKKIFKTVDGGKHWETISWSSATAPYTSYADVQFITANVGYISGYHVDDVAMNFAFTEFVMKTEDGGKSWSEVEIPTKKDNRQIQLQFITEDLGFVKLGRSQFGDDLYKTIDGGKSWVRNSLDSLERINAFYWITAKTGLMFGRDPHYRPRLFRTEDAGEHWDPVTLPLFSDHNEEAIHDFAFSDVNNGYAVGIGGTILKTADSGKTWHLSNPGYPIFYAADFIDDKIGFATSTSGFYKTIDGGNSWTYSNQSDSLIILSIDFNNANDGYFYGYKNYYYQVTQENQKIEKLTLPVIFSYSSRMISEGDSLFVCGSTLSPTANVFLRSGDRGKTWHTTTLPNTDFALSMNRINHTTIISDASHIIKSSNGTNWKLIKSFQDDYMQSMMFINEQIGLAALYKGMMRTSDGGETWERVGPFNGNTTIHKFFKATNHIIFAYGFQYIQGAPQGAIWKSSDAGLNWHEEVLPMFVDELVSEMRVVGDSVFAIGGYGQILKAPLESEVLGVEGEDHDAWDVFPIPTSEHINFQFKSSEIVNQVSITDMQSRITSATFEKKENVYSVNTENLTSGLYILTVFTKNKAYRKRFLKSKN